MRDVATHAGVSPKTVSNVMNGYPYIREATRVRVLASIDALGYQMATFGSWERGVLRECYELVDHISCHAYYGDDDGDVNAELKSSKRIDISFDEWNVWCQDRSRRTDGPGDRWEVAPRRIEDEYNVSDAVVVGNLLISLLRHSDRVAVACLAQLANAIVAGQVLRVRTDSPLIDTARFRGGAQRRRGRDVRPGSRQAGRLPGEPMKPVRAVRRAAVNSDREASGRAAGPRARPVSDR